MYRALPAGASYFMYECPLCGHRSRFPIWAWAGNGGLRCKGDDCGVLISYWTQEPICDRDVTVDCTEALWRTMDAEWDNRYPGPTCTRRVHTVLPKPPARFECSCGHLLCRWCASADHERHLLEHYGRKISLTLL